MGHEMNEVDRFNFKKFSQKFTRIVIFTNSILLIIDKPFYENSVDPDQLASEEAS